MTAFGPPGLTPSTGDKRYPQKSDNVKAMRALRFGLPSAPPPRVPSPTVTMTSTNPAGTPTLWSGLVAGAPNPAFRVSSGPARACGAVFPYSAGLMTEPMPMFPNTYGQSTVDFWSDAPSLTFYLVRAQLGQFRVLVDNDDGTPPLEVLRVLTSVRNGTAQTGAASTITLDAGASATNGLYAGNWLRIVSGTGAGQQMQISGYVGATKVATIGGAWTTNPDATSVFEIAAEKFTHTTSTQTGYSTYYENVDWSGERRHRHYRVESNGFSFLGVYVTSAIDSVYPSARPTGTPTIWGGDSFSAGAGADAEFSALSRVTCDRLGWNMLRASIGGTGYLNNGGTSSYSLTLQDRWFPPVNAWRIYTGLGSTGSYVITQGATSATIGCSDSVTTIQATLDTAFGAGAFTVAGGSGLSVWLLGRGATATVTTAMTANFTGVTNGLNTITQYVGDLALRVPLNGAGAPMPFNVVIAMGRNDTTGSNAAYTAAALQAAATLLIQSVQNAYLTATVYVVSIMYLPGGSTNAAVTNADAAIAAACAAAPLRLVNGKIPLIQPVAAGWMTGSGYLGGQAGNGNSDLACYTDATHPTVYGHKIYGHRIAEAIMALHS